MLGLGLLALAAYRLPSAGGRACNDFGQVRVAHQAIHEVVVSTSDFCVSFQNDVYQRFSGYVVKHRMGQMCENALRVFDDLRRLATHGVRPSSSNSAVCIEAQNSGDAGANALAAASAIIKLDSEIDSLLTDANSQGDGTLRAALGEHLGDLVNNLVQSLQLWRQSGGDTPDIRWPEIALYTSDRLAKLLNITFENIQEGVTYNIGLMNVSDLPWFFSFLDSFPSSIPVQLRRTGAEAGGECRDMPRIYRASHVFDPLADPAHWRTRDVSGMLAPRPPVHKILHAIGKSLPLSYNMIAVLPRAQVGAQELTSEYKNMFTQTDGHSAPSSKLLGSITEPSCNGIGLSYSPAHCLFDMGWGSMLFSLSTEPPFDGVLSVTEMSQKTSRPRPFVQPVSNGASNLDKLIEFVDSVYKSLNTPSPDILFLSPMVGNCLTMRKLGPSRRDLGGAGTPQLTPKLVWVPINPLVPPPWELAPNFTEWHARWLSQAEAAGHQDAKGSAGETAWWYAQCSLSSAVAVLKEQGYVLLHVEHSFAVFVLGVLWAAVAAMVSSPPAAARGAAAVHPPSSLYDHWLNGWFCSPVASTLLGLEWGAGAAMGLLHSHKVPIAEKRKVLCEFIQNHNLPLPVGHASPCEEATDTTTRAAGAGSSKSWRTWELQDPPEERGKAHLLESAGRGRCVSQLGFCECFPPYRGRFCESEELGAKDSERQYKAVLHYLVGDREKLLNDFVRTLPLLWARFNSRFDYPVVVFHDGMAPESRKRILEASPNRIWFAYVDDYKAVPAFLQGRMELDLGGYSIGYRGMCRFRSGPMFMQPVMKNFDFAWTLDTDGYFPADIYSDPFERMWRDGKIYGYSHVSRDQASAVQHFWEFCRLYLESKGIDPKGTQMMRRITDALVLRDTYWHEWNRVLFMNDIEITQLAWFRGEQYQDFFKYLDSVGGFWLYRWGDHAVRTIAIALFLDPGKLIKMGVPYGHQSTCRCGEEHPDEVCVRTRPSDWWRCVARSEAPTGEVVSGDVGTVHDSLLFSGE